MIQIFKTEQVRRLDAASIESEHISSLELMERAAEGLSTCLMARIDKEKSILFVAGPGNNGGDALAVARMMFEKGYRRMDCLLLSGGKELSVDCRKNLERLSLNVLTETEAIYKSYDYLVDGLFGTGLNRPLEGKFAEAVEWINRQQTSTKIISIDLPSGLFGENNFRDGKASQIVVNADWVLGIQFPRLAFLMPENTVFIKKWTLSPLAFSPQVLEQVCSPYHMIEATDLKQFIHTRTTFSHKGNFGHGLLIAGSYEMCGAAILAARAALRSGIGLLDVLTPSSAYPTLQAAVPEAMVRRDAVNDKHFASIEGLRFDSLKAIAVGPGLGKDDTQRSALKSLLQRIDSHTPLVLDADALNILSEERDLWELLPEDCILTPHPKEFDRMAGASSCGYERWEKACNFAQQHQVHIVLKGAYTAVIAPDGSCSFNTTGNPGMASGGSGDVLSGILLSLLAQGYSAIQACQLGVYLHGLSGDMALENESVESLSAGDLIQYFGKAFLSLTK